MKDNQIQIFQYIQYKLLEWYVLSNDCEYNENDFSILKSMKLLFFTVSANCKKDNSLLDTTFTDFVAMPYGHVEINVYNKLKNPLIHKDFKIDNEKTYFSSIKDFSDISHTIKSEIDHSVDILKKSNYKLINYTAFQLVELSHRFDSWLKTYKTAQEGGRKIEVIEPDLIKNEMKFYIL